MNEDLADYRVQRDALKNDVYFTSARNTGRLSKDTSKVGAIIVNGNEVVSEGYNGPPAAFSDERVPWERTASDMYARTASGRQVGCRTNKYSWVRHAEANAIRYALRRDYRLLQGSRIYVTRFPCPGCALTIAENGISEVHVDIKHTVIDDTYYCISPDSNGGMTSESINESIVILSEAGVKIYCAGVLL